MGSGEQLVLQPGLTSFMHLRSTAGSLVCWPVPPGAADLQASAVSRAGSRGRSGLPGEEENVQASEGERQDQHNQTRLKGWRKTPLPDGGGGGTTTESLCTGKSRVLAAVASAPDSVKYLSAELQE